MKSELQLRIDYTDDAITILNKVNRILGLLGYQFVDDNQTHDGFVVFNLDEEWN